MTASKPTALRPSRLLLLLATITTGVTLAACGQTSDDTRSATAGLPDLEQSLTAHQWLLDTGDSSLTRAGTNPVTLAFASGNKASGTAPCNTYRAQVSIENDDQVTFDHITATSKSCEPAVMQAEKEYLYALARVHTADVTDRNRLLLKSDGVRLSFSASTSKS